MNSDSIYNVVFGVLGVAICACLWVSCFEPMYMISVRDSHIKNDWNDECERHGMQDEIAPSGVTYCK